MAEKIGCLVGGASYGLAAWEPAEVTEDTEGPLGLFLSAPLWQPNNDIHFSPDSQPPWKHFFEKGLQASKNFHTVITVWKWLIFLSFYWYFIRNEIAGARLA